MQMDTLSHSLHFQYRLGPAVSTRHCRSFKKQQRYILLVSGVKALTGALCRWLARSLRVVALSISNCDGSGRLVGYWMTPCTFLNTRGMRHIVDAALFSEPIPDNYNSLNARNAVIGTRKESKPQDDDQISFLASLTLPFSTSPVLYRPRTFLFRA